MTETSTETEPQAGTGTDSKPAEKTLTQSEVDRLLGERLAREREKYADYDDLKAAASRLKEIEDAGKSEQQKLADQLAAAQRQIAERDAALAEATQASLRATVAADKGVPASSLTGSTKEELEAAADQLIAWRDAAKSATRRTTAPTGLKSGASSSGDTSANPKEAAALALRRMFNPGS